ncbi:MAG: DUF937 domain-containing protein [Methylacidiphilales bacterium]|nr:DUF937 domain-containing protein [Candidatus Methylacidiphilales bacterium]
MFNLYEIIANAQGGAAMANLARLYGLSPDQTRAAVEALLPAFALGLKRTTETPDGLSQFFGMLNRTPYTEWFENAGRLFADASQAMGFRQREPAMPGDEVLAMLFGSKDVSRAVAAQAAALSGVGIEVTKAMMPVVAAMIAGGMMNAMRSQAGMAEAFQRAFAPMMAPQPTPEPAPSGPADIVSVWTNMMQTMLGQSEPPRPKAQPPAGPDIAAMTEQIQDLGRTGNATFSKMFEAGVDAQKAHMERLSQIFDAFVESSKARSP